MVPLKCYVSWRTIHAKTPTEIKEFQENVISKMRKSYSAYNFILHDTIDPYFDKDRPIKSLGYSITKMDECNIVLSPWDYYRSNGCFIEFLVALKYHKPIYFYYNEGKTIYNIVDVSKVIRENNIVFTNPEENIRWEQISMEELLPNDN